MLKKYIYVSLILIGNLYLTACGDGGGKSTPGGSSNEGSGSGKATLSLSGDIDKLETYGSSGTKNTVVFCSESAVGAYSEISVWSVKDGTDTNTYSNRIEDLSLSFHTAKLPEGKFEINRDNNTFFSYRRLISGEELVLLNPTAKFCTFNFTRSGAKVNVSFDCPELRSSNSPYSQVALKGTIECEPMKL